MKTHVFRLTPNQDLRQEIRKLAAREKIKAGAVIACVGSLKTVILRMAGTLAIKKMEGDFEIVSLSGTLADDDEHLHISVADENGMVTGGHLRNGSLVNTTVELAIAEFPGIAFVRENDPATGFVELQIKTKS